jgi:hypothetical protein
MTITCPKCKSEFPLTEEALAGQIEGEVARRIAPERKALIAEATRNARRANDLEQKLGEVDLEVERRVRERLDGATLGVKETVEQHYALQLQDRDTKLGQLRTQIEDLQRRLAQGSQQLQGESQELSVEQELRAAFPGDTFTPVAKGEPGADLLQIVVAQGGQVCGKILWECKRTKNWNAAWLEKLRGDQRASNADVSVLVSQAVPADVTSFKHIDDVWVTRRPLIVPVASMLRAALIRCAFARVTSQGRHTKADLVYDYLTGSSFAHRIMPVIESLTHLRRDLDAKRTRIERELAKEEQRIVVAQTSVQRLIGDLQGIAGVTIEELEEAPIPALVAAMN